MKIQYRKIRLRPAALHVIEKVNEILAEYEQHGIDLTVRQIYYQFVARDLIPNNQKEYKKLASIINDGRIAGLISWKSIQDRTRNLQRLATFDDPPDLLEAAVASYREDIWATQRTRVEVWIEKDAGVGNIEQICRSLRVPFFSCRGYTSQSEMWVAAQRFLNYFETGQRVTILHFGDHDPSGIDMSRDIEERLGMFIGEDARDAGYLEVERMALNMPQIKRYRPPPNPAKLTDSRVHEYIAKFGKQSWELDALDPRVIQTMIRDAVEDIIDADKMNSAKQAEAVNKEKINKIATNWEKVDWKTLEKEKKGKK